MTTKTFEDRLLDELKRELVLHANGPVAAPVPVYRRVTVRRAAWGLAACGALAATAILVPGSPAESPAYAVERQPDGTVTVDGTEFKDPKQLEHDLRAAGLNATVTRFLDGKDCSRGGLAGSAADRERNAIMDAVNKASQKAVTWADGPGVHLVINPSKLTKGQSLQVDISTSTSDGVVAKDGTTTEFEGRPTTHLEVYVVGRKPLPTARYLDVDAGSHQPVFNNCEVE